MINGLSIQEIKHVMEAALTELEYAPCRDNPEHTLCLKCRTQQLIMDMLNEIEYLEQD